MKSPLNTTFGLALALGIFANPAMAAVVIDYVTIGNADNSPDATTGYGSVSYDYKIGKNEVTVGQYVEFLNSVAKTDTYGLFNTNMGTSTNAGGITRSGSDGNYVYTATPSKVNMPVTFVRWFDAARFANWIHNGQPVTQSSSATETGAYTLNNAISGVSIARNINATVWIPSENEWYKAAYYDPNKGGLGIGGYWTHATQSNSLSGNTIGEASSANYNDGDPAPPSGTVRLTVVGAYGTNSDSAYGTNDQAGNVWEMTDTVNGSNFVMRGGSWFVNDGFAASSNRSNLGPTTENQVTGFRLATLAVIPEPSTALFSILAISASLVRRNRRS